MTDQAVSTHTPGPWWIEERKSYFAIKGAHPPANFYTEPRLVANCAKPHEDALWNARLIAAAPDLLEAALRLSALAEQIWGQMSDSEAAAIREAWVEMDTAIAKAIGPAL